MPRRRRGWETTVLAGVSVACFGCASAAPGQAVPAMPPDSVPSDLYHDSVMVADGGGRWSRAVLAVAFDPDTDQTVRARAIASVSGRVVGGVVLHPRGHGYYLVWVPHGETLADVDAAIAALAKTPGVESAIRISALAPVGDATSAQAPCQPAASRSRTAAQATRCRYRAVLASRSTSTTGRSEATTPGVSMGVPDSLAGAPEGLRPVSAA